MTTETRQAAHRLGHVAEWRAVWRLRLAGYSILARRYKTKLGEIDIVVRRGGMLAFVEVKARADHPGRHRRAGRPAVRPRGARRQPVPGAPSALCRPFGALRCRAGRRASGRAICPTSGGRRSDAVSSHESRGPAAAWPPARSLRRRWRRARLDLLEAALTLSVLRSDEPLDLAPFRQHVAAMASRSRRPGAPARRLARGAGRGRSPGPTAIAATARPTTTCRTPTSCA